MTVLICHILVIECLTREDVWTMRIINICRESIKAISFWSSIDIRDLSEICKVFDESNLLENMKSFTIIVIYCLPKVIMSWQWLISRLCNEQSLWIERERVKNISQSCLQSSRGCRKNPTVVQVHPTITMPWPPCGNTSTRHVALQNHRPRTKGSC